VAAGTGNPGWAFCKKVAHPVRRLQVVLKGGTPKQTDLRKVGRAEARLSALTLDGFDHRGLFAANISAGAPSKMDSRDGVRRFGLQFCDLALEDRAAAVILVAEVNINRVDPNGPGRDERAFNKAVRIEIGRASRRERG